MVMIDYNLAQVGQSYLSQGQMAFRSKDGSNQVIESHLDAALNEIGESLKGDCLSFVGPIHYGFDTAIRDALESIKKKRRRLLVILDTGGGLIEIAERMADSFRYHYREVDFIVPDSAKSAGTVLVMSGNSIYMDYFSTLGPIDPQIERPGTGVLIPAMGYIKEFNRLVEKSSRQELTTAEMTYLTNNFNAAEIYLFQQARELSVDLLEKWLVKYKFRNWKVTRTRKIKVTPKMRRDRAKWIGEQLSDVDRWHSHRRSIPIDVLRRKLKLDIEDFGKNADLKNGIRRYSGLLEDYMAQKRLIAIVHTMGRFVWLLRKG